MADSQVTMTVNDGVDLISQLYHMYHDDDDDEVFEPTTCHPLQPTRSYQSPVSLGTHLDPQAEFFLDHRRLDKIYGCFSAEPKKCVIVNLRLKSHAVFNFFRPSRKASISKLTAVILCG